MRKNVKKQLALRVLSTAALVAMVSSIATAAFAEEYKYVGAYATGIDYMTGDHSAGNNTIMSAYIAGTSGLTAAETIKLLNDNVYMDMQDTLINDPPVDWYPRQNPKKDFDRSWLN